MRYQEVKLREARRLGVFALVAGAGVALSLIFHDQIERILEFIPSRRGDRYEALIFLLSLLTMIFAVASLANLLTSPAQDARALKWSADRGRRPRRAFDQNLLEPNHPDWDVPTLTYLLRRRRA